MPILIGIILLAFAISLAVTWWSALVVVLQGLCIVTLFLVGSILILIGYSARKATRECEAALDGGNDAERAEETLPAECDA